MALNIVEKIDHPVKVNNVLLSVSDKSGLDMIVLALVEMNPDIKIYSTGGTYVAIERILGENSKKNLIKVSDYTGQPEMQGGLVKTLDFKIYLGLLSETYNDSHQADLKRVNGVAIDMVIVNLYPFKETITREDVTPEMARTNIDIGGPCMIRAAAKNFLRVASVTEPSDYASIVEELKNNSGYISLAKRFELSGKAFAHTAEYDATIAGYFNSVTLDDVCDCYEL